MDLIAFGSFQFDEFWSARKAIVPMILQLTDISPSITGCGRVPETHNIHDYVNDHNSQVYPPPVTQIRPPAPEA